MGEAETERYDEIGSLAQTFKGDEVFAAEVGTSGSVLYDGT
jgi:hypothetical protein